MEKNYIVVVTRLDGEQYQRHFTNLMSMWEYAMERKKIAATEKIELLTKQTLFRKD